MKRAKIAAAMLALSWAVQAPSAAEGPAFSLEALKSGQALITDEVKPGGKTWVTAIFWLKTEPDAVFRILRDVEHHPEFMPEVKEARIVERGPGYHVAHFRAGEGFFASEHTLKRVYDEPERRISWSLVQGRPKDLSGYWHVQQSPDGVGSLVTYSAYIDVGVLVPDVLTRYFAKRTVPLMIDNLRKRSESGGRWQSDEYRRRSQGNR